MEGDGGGDMPSRWIHRTPSYRSRRSDKSCSVQVYAEVVSHSLQFRSPFNSTQVTYQIFRKLLLYNLCPVGAVLTHSQ